MSEIDYLVMPVMAHISERPSVVACCITNKKVGTGHRQKRKALNHLLTWKEENCDVAFIKFYFSVICDIHPCVLYVATNKCIDLARHRPAERVDMTPGDSVHHLTNIWRLTPLTSEILILSSGRPRVMVSPGLVSLL